MLHLFLRKVQLLEDILLGFPGAKIYSFDEGVIEEVQYEQTNHYQVTSYFFHNRTRMLDELLKDEE